MSEKKIRTLEEAEAEMITVNDEYLIAIDPYNYVARRRGQVAAIGYFGSIQNALTCIYEDMCKRKLKKEAKDLPNIVAIIDKCKNEIKAAIKNNFPEYEVVKK